MEHINQPQHQKKAEETKTTAEQGGEKSLPDARPVSLRQRELQETLMSHPSAVKAAQLKAVMNQSPQVRKGAQLQAMADQSPQVQKGKQLQNFINGSALVTIQRKRQEDLFGAHIQRKKLEEDEVIQEKTETGDGKQQSPQNKEHNTGLPDNLKQGIEDLSGYSMNDVKVEFNSSSPAKLQAHAYTQGNNIHVGPGQEKHLPHEAWHVVQQKQGRVTPNLQLKGIAINDDTTLEQEADVMGDKALKTGNGKKDNPQEDVKETPASTGTSGTVQRRIIFEKNPVEPKKKKWREFLDTLPYRLTRLKGLETLLKDLVEEDRDIDGENIDELEAAVLERLEHRQKNPDLYRQKILDALQEDHKKDATPLINDDGKTYIEKGERRKENTRLSNRKQREEKMKGLEQEMRPRDKRIEELEQINMEIETLNQRRQSGEKLSAGELSRLESLKQKQFELEIEVNIDGAEQYIMDDSTTIRIDQGAFMSGDKYGVAMAVRNHPSVILNLLWDESFYLKKYLQQAVEEGFVNERGEPDLLNYYNYLHPNRPIEEPEKIAQALRQKMKATADEVYKFYIKCGIPEHRIKLRHVSNAAIQMDAYAVGNTTEITKQYLSETGEEGREQARKTFLGKLTKEEIAEVDKVVDNDHEIQNAPLITLIWLRKSGVMPGGAYPHLDTYKPVVRQIIRIIREVCPVATVWMIGDRIYESTNDSQWKNEINMTDHNLMEYWKNWKGNPDIPTNWNLNQQFYFLDKIRHKSISIGMRSGMLEGPAMMGMRTIWIDHYQSTGKERMEKYSEGPMSDNYKLFELEHSGKEMQVLHDMLQDLDRIAEWLRQGSAEGTHDEDTEEGPSPSVALYEIAECIQDTLESLELSSEHTEGASSRTRSFLKMAASDNKSREEAIRLLQDIKSGKTKDKKHYEEAVKLIKEEQAEARRKADRAERLRQRVKEIAHKYIQRGLLIATDEDEESKDKILEAIEVFREEIVFRLSEKEQENFADLFTGFATEII